MSQSDPLEVVLVGCGAVSQLFYAPALAELERHGMLRVAELVDPSDLARGRLAGSFPAAVSCREMSKNRERPALAIIASPPKFHRGHVEAALEAGDHVLCEKPMAGTPADCEAMISAAASAGRVLAVGHYKRFMPAHQALKHLIDKQPFGPLRHLEIAEGGKFAWPAASDSFFRKEQTPGGVLLDIGVHVLDLVGWWLGEPTTFRYADDARDGLEANCLLEAHFADGASARIRLSRDWATPQCYHFKFERAGVHCRVNASNRLELTLDGLPLTFAAELRDPLPPRPAAESRPLETNAQSFISQLVDVCSAIREGHAPAVPGTEGIRAVRWISECYARREPMKEPWQVATPSALSA